MLHSIARVTTTVASALPALRAPALRLLASPSLGMAFPPVDAGTTIPRRTFSTVCCSAPVTEADVKAEQHEWANAIVAISESYLTNGPTGPFVELAKEAAANLYAYGHGQMLFKPTKAADNQFRPTVAGALSYFVGFEHMPIPGGFEEDGGFAINNGNGWAACRFENDRDVENNRDRIVLIGGQAFVMGNYYFTCHTNKSLEIKVEYTFGYKRCDDGKVRIFLHHSSTPHVKDGDAPQEKCPELHP